MNRLLALLLVSGTVVAVGCGYGNYDLRLEATEARIKDEITLNKVLEAPMSGDAQKLSIYVRGPKGWTFAPAFAPEYTTSNPQYEDSIAGYFDVRGSYVAPPAAPAAAKKEAAAEAPPASPVLRILARRKKEVAETEKAEKPPEQPAVGRGEFLADLLQLLRTFYAGDSEAATPEPVSKTIWPRAQPPKSIDYQRYKFNGSNGQLVHVYIFKDLRGTTEYDVAMIFEFPDGQVPSTSTSPVDLALGTLAVGPRAVALFSGDTEESGDASGADAGPAVAF